MTLLNIGYNSYVMVQGLYLLSSFEILMLLKINDLQGQRSLLLQRHNSHVLVPSCIWLLGHYFELFPLRQSKPPYIQRNPIKTAGHLGPAESG